MRRSLTVGALALAILTAGAGPALAKHDGDHRPRPPQPVSPPGVEEAVQDDQANSPQTGRINGFVHGNNPND